MVKLSFYMIPYITFDLLPDTTHDSIERKIIGGSERKGMAQWQYSQVITNPPPVLTTQNEKI